MAPLASQHPILQPMPAELCSQRLRARASRCRAARMQTLGPSRLVAGPDALLDRRRPPAHRSASACGHDVQAAASCRALFTGLAAGACSEAAGSGSGQWCGQCSLLASSAGGEWRRMQQPCASPMRSRQSSMIPGLTPQVSGAPVVMCFTRRPAQWSPQPDDDAVTSGRRPRQGPWQSRCLLRVPATAAERCTHRC